MARRIFIATPFFGCMSKFMFRLLVKFFFNALDPLFRRIDFVLCMCVILNWHSSSLKPEIITGLYIYIYNYVELFLVMQLNATGDLI